MQVATGRLTARIREAAGPVAPPRIDAADLVATASAGTSLGELDRALAAQGTFLALDPPGGGDRTLGSALACGAGGPLAAGYGPARDQVLGLSFVAGNGLLVRTGGRVVKNVAGFDLAKLLIGSHGAFGVIAEVHLRLRARPAADLTRAFALGNPGEAEAVQGAGSAGAACELVGAAGAWTLLVRSLGTAEGVDEEMAAIAGRLNGSAPREAASDVWAAWRTTVGAWPVLLRVGAGPHDWLEALALLERVPGLMGISVTVPRGTVRAGLASLGGEQARELRAAARERGWPVTLERADRATLSAAGIWGALDPLVLELSRALKAVFDPDGVFDVPLWANGS